MPTRKDHSLTPFNMDLFWDRKSEGERSITEVQYFDLLNWYSNNSSHNPLKAFQYGRL